MRFREKRLKERMDEDYKFYVESILIFAEEDNWNDGVIPGAGFDDFIKVNEEFDSFKDMKNYLTRNYGLTKDESAWGVFSGENGRIDVQHMEDSRGNIITSSDREWEEFKLGNTTLYLVTYSIYLSLIKKYKPTNSELVKITGLQEI